MTLIRINFGKYRIPTVLSRDLNFGTREFPKFFSRKINFPNPKFASQEIGKKISWIPVSRNLIPGIFFQKLTAVIKTVFSSQKKNKNIFFQRTTVKILILKRYRYRPVTVPLQLQRTVTHRRPPLHTVTLPSTTVTQPLLTVHHRSSPLREKFFLNKLCNENFIGKILKKDLT